MEQHDYKNLCTDGANLAAVECSNQHRPSLQNPKKTTLILLEADLQAVMVVTSISSFSNYVLHPVTDTSATVDISIFFSCKCFKPLLK